SCDRSRPARNRSRSRAFPDQGEMRSPAFQAAFERARVKRPLERVDTARAEVRAAAAPQFGERMVEAHRLAVDAACGQRVERGGNVDDSRGERDRIAGEAVRVAL